MNPRLFSLRFAKILASIFTATLLMLSAGPAGAQTASANIVITWHAFGSYVPPSYRGKALPNAQSPIIASVQVFSGNQLVNIGSQTIYWYLDGTLIGGGTGSQSISLSPFGGDGPDQTLKVELPDYSGGLIEAVTPITVMQPLVVIPAPSADGNFSSIPLTVRALPYFFAVSSSSNLSFAWTVGNTPVTNAENPDQLQINIPSSTPAGTSVGIYLVVTNSADSTSAQSQTTVAYEPLPS